MKTINNIELEILRGDITKLSVEGLIVPQSEARVLANPLNKRLYYCGAAEGFENYNQFADFGLATPGNVLFSEGGGNAKFLLQASVNKESALVDVLMCLGKALQMAKENNIQTLALPELRDEQGNLLLTFAETVQAVISALMTYPNDMNVIKEFSIVLDCSEKEYERAVDMFEETILQTA